MRLVSVKKSSVTARDYKKAWLRLLSQVASLPRRAIGAIDRFFFMQDGTDADVKPYFYGGLAAMVSVMLLVYVAIN